MPLFGPPNVEKLKIKRDVKGLIKALGYKKGTDVRREAAETLGEIGDARAVDPLIAALRDGDEYVRRAAAGALGQIGDARAVDALTVTLRDRSKGMRLAATEALGKLGDVRAVEPLILALRDKKWDVREAAATALGHIANARAVKPLVTVALTDEYMWVTLATIWALSKIGDPQAVLGLVAVLKKSEKVDVRKAAAEALDQLGWQPDTSAVEAAYWAAKQEWKKCIEMGIPAIEPLVVALRGETRGRGRAVERKAAVEGLGQIGDARAVEPLISALKDEDGGVRRAAAEGLVRMYGTGNLDDVQKRRILAQRDTITRHQDSSEYVHDHADFGDVDCVGQGSRQHKDIGIGVDFPL